MVYVDDNLASRLKAFETPTYMIPNQIDSKPKKYFPSSLKQTINWFGLFLNKLATYQKMKKLKLSTNVDGFRTTRYRLACVPYKIPYILGEDNI